MRIEPNTLKSTTLFAAAAAAAAATSASTDSAMAGDWASHAAPPPVPSWQGLYVGGSIGVSWLNSVADDAAALPFGSYGGGQRGTATGVGWLGGLDVGYNWQDRNFVYGVEADLSWLGSTKDTVHGTTGYIGYTTNKTSRVNGLSTFRGRFGFDFDGTMPYVTFGVAVGDIKSTYSLTTPAAITNSTSKTSWQPGLVLGGGIEHQFANHWSLRGEVLWVGFKDTSVIPAAPGYAGAGTAAFSNSLVLGRVGLNYKF